MSEGAERLRALREAPPGVARLVRLMAILRGPGGCPWDHDQTHASLRRYLIEEAAELIDAIDGGDDEAIAEELGDVLLQVVFHAQIGAESGRFDLDVVAEREVAKMVERHPHVFGEETAESAADVLGAWEKRKRARKPRTGIGEGVPRAMPALTRAQTISARAAGLGFDWTDVVELWPKIGEELGELKRHLDAPGAPDRDGIEDELGDVLFALVNLARQLDLDAEAALRRATDKFAARFDRMPHPAAPRRSGPEAAAAWDAAWTEAKRRLDGEA